VDAILGSLIHEALQHSGDDGPDAVSAYVRSALESQRALIPTFADQREFVPLRELLLSTRLSAKLAAARRFSELYHRGRRVVKGAERGSSTTRRFSAGMWREVRLVSEDGKLSGQIDLLKVEGSRCTIVDFKTGSAVAADGKPRESYINQLHLYQLLAAEAVPASFFRLEIISSSGTSQIEDSEALREKLRSRIQEVSNRTPLGVAVEGDGLASTSEGCRYCAFRPWCRNYQTDAVEMWRSRKPP
jgi:RecB family exonuclease